MARQDPQMKLRLTEELKEKIATAAEKSGRSMNAEIVERLDWSFDRAAEERADFLKLVHDQDTEIRILKEKLKAPEEEITRLKKELENEGEAFLRMSRLYDHTFDVAIGYREVLATAKGQLLQYLSMVKSLAGIILNLNGPPAVELIDMAKRMEKAASETEERLVQESKLEARGELRRTARSIAVTEDDPLNKK